MSEQLLYVKGLSDLNKFLETLPPKLEANVLRGAFKAGMEPIKAAAQAGIHNVSGHLAASLKITTRRAGDGTVMATLRTKVFYARFVEYGVREHRITSKGNKALSIGGLFFQSVKHPGIKPKAFMRPALDNQAEAAVIAAAEYIKERLATKGGLDTAGIDIRAEGP